MCVCFGALVKCRVSKEGERDRKREFWAVHFCALHGRVNNQHTTHCIYIIYLSFASLVYIYYIILLIWFLGIYIIFFIIHTPTTDFCYECVPPLVFALARIERVKYENFCTALEQLKNMINPAIISNTDVTKWAYNVVSTRCIDQKNKNDNNKNNNGQELLLAPMADMVRFYVIFVLFCFGCLSSFLFTFPKKKGVL